MQKFVADIEKALSSSPIILSSNLQKQFGSDNDTVYIKGNIMVIDSSVLEIALFAGRSRGVLVVDKYRFHYMDRRGRLIFRYDNAPHHKEISSFPNHKHTSSGVAESSRPSIQDVLNEISAFILGK